jgi:hypothetical protein
MPNWMDSALLGVILIFTGTLSGCRSAIIGPQTSTQSPQTELAQKAAPTKVREASLGLPIDVQPNDVVAMVKVKAGQFEDPNTPILASAVTNVPLISVISQILGEKNSTELFKFRLYNGEVKLLPAGIKILRRDGVSDSNLTTFSSMSEQGANELRERRGKAEIANNWLRDRTIAMPPPKSGGLIWEVPFIVGDDSLFIEKVVANQVETKPIFHFNWVSPDYESTLGQIEVLVFPCGEFPIGIMSFSPEKWTRPGGKLMPYKYEDMDHLVAGVVKFKGSAGMKIRVSYKDKNAEMVEDAVYFSNVSALIAVRLRAKKSSFYKVEKEGFIPFLNGVVIHDPRLSVR